MDAGGVGMLKQWQIVLYVVTVTLVVATVNRALAVESSDGWRPKSRSEPKEVTSNKDEEMLQLVPGESSQAATEDGTQEENNTPAQNEQDNGKAKECLKEKLTEKLVKIEKVMQARKFMRDL